MKKILLLAVFASTSLAAAALPITDPSKLGGDVTALAGAVLFIVQFLKRQFERQGKKLPWWGTIALTVAVGQVLGALLFYSGYGARFGSSAPPMTWITFGLVASGIAAGFKDFAATLAERGRSTVVVNQPQVQPSRPPAALPPSVLPADLAPIDPSTLPGFRPLLASETIEDVLRQTGEWPAVPGLDDAPLGSHVD
ncbi:hypothetical protein DM785_02775 [Deinococcus actinosclerus]|nr:hypothetical protein DM785_02775 [Deinococcus actinosclerus]